MLHRQLNTNMHSFQIAPLMGTARWFCTNPKARPVHMSDIHPSAMHDLSYIIIILCQYGRLSWILQTSCPMAVAWLLVMSLVVGLLWSQSQEFYNNYFPCFLVVMVFGCYMYQLLLFTSCSYVPQVAMVPNCSGLCLFQSSFQSPTL